MKLALLFLVIFLVVPDTRAQQSEPARPLRGVVWQEPAELRSAMADLLRMREMGVEAVRTPLVSDPRLLTLTDTLRMFLFQEVPVRRLAAARLRDTLAYAQQALTPMLRLSSVHPSARTFGLARESDTSDPAACAYFEQLASYARQAGGPGTRVYYTTRFIEDDVCSHTVDFVLIDGLRAEDPVSLIERWRVAHPETRVGISAVGRDVSRSAVRGLNAEGSPEAQARYLERVLRRLMRPSDVMAPVALFVYRWRDAELDRPSPEFDLENPYSHRFGLYTRQNVERPAADVVSGIYGRGQNVFAFAAGRETPAHYPLPTLAGWLVVLILAISYASSARLRQMVPRYFAAHGFYREAVREGRDVLMTASVVLLAVMALAVAVIWMVLLDVWRTNDAFLLLYQMLPRSVEEFIIILLGRPFLLLLLVASVYAVAVTLWSSVLALASRRRYPLNPAQAMMLAIWPRWGMLVVMLAAMVIATLPREAAFLPSLYLAAAWLGVVIVSIARTLYDYYAITHVRVGRIVGGLVFNPLILLLIALVFLALEYRPEVAFLWNTITRT